MDIYSRMDSDMEMRMDIRMEMHMEMRMDIHMGKGYCINYTTMVEVYRRNRVVCNNCPQHYLHRCSCSCLLRHSIRRIRSVFRIDGCREVDSFGNNFDNSFYILSLYNYLFLNISTPYMVTF
jgi:hypothetical protein